MDIKGVFYLTVLLVFCLSGFASADQAQDFKTALLDGKFDLELRYRYTNVDQESFDKDAHSSTVRGLLGYETLSFHNISAYGQLRTVQNLGGNNLFNDTLNGNTNRPTVADPDSFEIDQAYLKSTHIPDTEITVGRRKIALNNERFVSTLPWRQNANSFDGVVIENRSLPNSYLHYSYAYNFNRAFTDKSLVGNFDDANIHLIHGDYSVAPWLKIAGYGYLLGIEETSFPGASVSSTDTYGLNAKGTKAIGQSEWEAHYDLEYAHQRDNNDNARSFDLNYYRAVSGLGYKNVTVKVGYEVLEGDGITGFSTPLALLHAYNGFADVFGTTPASGLEDRFINATYKIDKSDIKIGRLDVLADTRFHIAYHDFNAENSPREFGQEFDATIEKKITDNYTLRFDYAHYNSDDAATDSFALDREKFFISFIANYDF